MCGLALMIGRPSCLPVIFGRSPQGKPPRRVDDFAQEIVATKEGGAITVRALA